MAASSRWRLYKKEQNWQNRIKYWHTYAAGAAFYTTLAGTIFCFVLFLGVLSEMYIYVTDIARAQRYRRRIRKPDVASDTKKLPETESESVIRWRFFLRSLYLPSFLLLLLFILLYIHPRMWSAYASVLSLSRSRLCGHATSRIISTLYANGGDQRTRSMDHKTDNNQKK